MPAPIPDLSRDQTCHHYQAPTGQRCGSPALKGEYYCYHHHIKHAHRSRVLIDPEVTRMELPPVEDRASIFVALAAIVHRLAENTIDTRRASIMVHALHGNLRALQNPRPPKAPPEPTPPPAPDSHPETPHEAQSAPETPPVPASQPDAHSAAKPLQTITASSLEPSDALAPHSPHRTPQAQTSHLAPPAPTQISISKESLLYFLRSRHCAHCNAELFPAHQLTERRHPGAWPTIIEGAFRVQHRISAVIPDRPPDRPSPFSAMALAAMDGAPGP